MEDRDILQFEEFSGSNSARATPVSIPNTEVKTRHADDTARETVWESRSPPDLKKEKPALNGFLFFLFEKRELGRNTQIPLLFYLA